MSAPCVAVMSPASDSETPRFDWIDGTIGPRIAPAITVSVADARITHRVARVFDGAAIGSRSGAGGRHPCGRPGVPPVRAGRFTSAAAGSPPVHATVLSASTRPRRRVGRIVPASLSAVRPRLPGPPKRMRRSGTWSFATATGTVAVAPNEVQIRRHLWTAVDHAGRALANGRIGPVVDAVGWSGVGAALTVLGALPRLLSVGDGGEALWLTALAGITVIGTLAAAVVGNRRATIPLRAIERVEFDDEGIVVVHEEDDDGWFGERWGRSGSDGGDDPTETRIRPLDDAERSDAALAFRLRGVDLRGAEADEGVTRTAIDAPKTELLE